jgi:hypothetical protein
MRRRFSLLVLVVLGLACGLPAQAQICGDATDDGTVNIADMVTILEYIGQNSGIAIDLGNADCDGRAGITVSDAQALAKYLFHGVQGLNCSPTGSYSFAPSLADTIFLPFMNSIPDDLDSVFLPMMISLEPNTDAFYVPTVYSQDGADAFFLRRIDQRESIQVAAAEFLLGDSLVFFGTDLSGSALDGHHEPLELVFWRQNPGVASLQTAAVNRSSLLAIAVEKDGDLYTPVIQYYEVPVPVPNVTVSETDLSFTAAAGAWSYTTHEVEFVSDSRQVSFNLEVSDDWIVVQDLPAEGLTTPATIVVLLDATELGIGNYSGQITIVNADPADAEFSTDHIVISATVNAPLMLPPGDLNCNGVVTISDVALLIDCLFIDPRPIPPCE